jgi:hypothetical protein
MLVAGLVVVGRGLTGVVVEEAGLVGLVVSDMRVVVDDGTVEVPEVLGCSGAVEEEVCGGAVTAPEHPAANHSATSAMTAAREGARATVACPLCFRVVPVIQDPCHGGEFTPRFAVALPVLMLRCRVAPNVSTTLHRTQRTRS